MTAASAVIARVHEVLSDVSAATYTSAQALAWVNQAQYAVCLVRPDAKSTTKSVQLVQGAKQTLPAGDRRLIGVTNFMGTDGTTPGATIDGPSDMNRWGRFKRNWRAESNAASPPTEYGYNPTEPNTYWVNPPVPASPNVYIEILVAQDPTELTDASDELQVADMYQPALIEWMLYCFWSRDDERSPNAARAQRHRQTFLEILGVKSQADAAVLPQAVEAGG